MQTSTFRRPLAIVLSLMMVISLFTICSFGAAAEPETNTASAVMASWSAEDLYAAAQQTGSVNVNGDPVYHLREGFVIGAERDDKTAGGAWLFHSQGRTQNSAGEWWSNGDTIQVVAYMKGDQREAAAIGRIEFVHKNNNELQTTWMLTQEMFDNAEDASWLGEGVKKLVFETTLDNAEYTDPGMFQQRVWVNGGAYLACYGMENINLTTNKLFFGMEPKQANAGMSSDNPQLKTTVLASYIKHDAVKGQIPSGCDKYTVQPTWDNSVTFDVPLFSGLELGKLQQGDYSLDLNFATQYGLGVRKYTLNIYAGDEQIVSQTLQQGDYVNNKWSPDSAIGREMKYAFTVDDDHAGQTYTAEILLHNNTFLFVKSMKLERVYDLNGLLGMWKAKDFLNSSERSETYAKTYDMEAKEAIGFVLCRGSGFIGAAYDGAKVTGVTLTEGHTVRFCQKIYAPNGFGNGHELWRVYDGGTKYLDEQPETYGSAATQYDETYGYAYKELYKDLVITEAMAGTHNLQHWMCTGNVNYAAQPVYFYGYSATDVDTGEVLYTIGADKLSDIPRQNDNADVVYGYKAGYDKGIGYRAKGNTPPNNSWTRFDIETGPLTANAPQEGDELVFGAWVWPTNGFTTEGNLGGIGFTVMHYTPDGSGGWNRGVELGAGMNYTDDGWNALPEQVDAAYGFTYKEISKTYTLSADDASNLAAKGAYVLLGDFEGQRDYNKYPLEVYRYFLYNKTQDVYYQDFNGAEIIGKGGSHTTNEEISVFVGNVDYAKDAFVKANTDVSFDKLTTPVLAEGLYNLYAIVAGEVGTTATLKAYIDGEVVASRNFAIKDDAEKDGKLIPLSLCASAEQVGKQIVIGVETAGSELGLLFAATRFSGDSFGGYDYQDMLFASSPSEMGAKEYDMSEQIPVGFQLSRGGGFIGALYDGAKVSDVTFEEGHTIRFSQKTYGPNGYATPFWRVYCEQPAGSFGSVKVADATNGDGLASYAAAPTQIDPTYGFAYKELFYDVTIDASNAGTWSHVGHWFCVPSNGDYAARPAQFFEFKATDMTTGEVLYTIGADQLIDIPRQNNNADIVYANAAGYEKAYGMKTVSAIPNHPVARFPVFDMFISPSEFDEGDEIETGVWMWADNGVNADNRITFDSTIRSDNYPPEVKGAQIVIDNMDDYDALPTHYDEQIGFPYKEIVLNYTLEGDVYTELSAHGRFNVLLGDEGHNEHDWANFPHTYYRYWIYNATKDIYYVDSYGPIGGGSGVNCETLTTFIGDPAYAKDGYVKANQDVVYTDLADDAPMVGQLAWSLTATGEEGANYTLKAYRLNSDGQPTLIAAMPFTGTGAEQTVELPFNVKDKDIDSMITFGIATEGKELPVDSVTLKYLGEVAPDFAWTAPEISANVTAEDVTRDYAPGGVTKEIIGLRIYNDTNPDSNGLWGTQDIRVENVTFEAGHTIRFELDMNIENTVTGGGPFFRVYKDGPNGMIADKSLGWDVWNSTEDLYNEQYDYEYKTIPYEVEITEAMAVNNNGVTHWICTPGAKYGDSPNLFYEFRAYDVTAGDELLYTIDGRTIASAKHSDNIVSEPIYFVTEDPTKITSVKFGADVEGDVITALTVDPEQVGPGVYKINIEGEGLTAKVWASNDDGSVFVDGDELVVREGDMSYGVVLVKEAGAEASVQKVSLEYLREVGEDDDDYAADIAAANQAAADEAEAKIDALPETVTAEDAEAVAAARDAVDALTDAQKALVDEEKLAKLEAAEQALADAAEAKEVTDKIEALPEEITLEDVEAVEEAQKAYDDASDGAKALISDEAKAKLDAASEKAADLKAAKAVEDQINALGEDASDEEIAAAKAAYDGLTPAQQNLVSDEAKAKIGLGADDVTYGDANGDGNINASDALLALQHSVKLKTLEGNTFKAADVNGDGAVNASDALLILQYSVKLIDIFPVQK